MMSRGENTRGVSTQSVLPLGRKSPRGTLRWYLASCPVGRERSTCERLRAILPADVLDAAFVPQVEREKKFHGEWRTDVVELFRTGGYLVVATRDATLLAKEMAALTFPVWLAGAMDGGYAPVSKDAQSFLTEVMDSLHIVRMSWGEIVEGDLRILRGPLMGHEKRVVKVVRKKALALVRLLGDAPGGEFTLALPLAIPTKR